MLIGIPKEVKDHEYRVGATPSTVSSLVQAGAKVLVQKNAGTAIGFSDHDYEKAGAKICQSAEEIYQAEMIIKVKEPQASEYAMLKSGQVLFCYLHLAPDPEQTKALLEQNIVAIAYETVVDHMGRLPLLVPMSEVAGRISIQVGAYMLQMANGGRGVLLGGVPGVEPAKVTVIGGGVVGTQAARMALGLGADVTILDNSLTRLRELDNHFGPRLKTLYASSANIENAVIHSDLVIGAVLIPGKMAPKLVTELMIKKMKKGSVVVDVAIDQGGCIETAKPTSHSHPTYLVHDVVHYCVTNMPGACARTSTEALTNATLPYALSIIKKGWKEALKEDKGLAMGLNVAYGKVTHPAVAHDLGYRYEPLF
jgi:alanine dehydrogenase